MSSTPSEYALDYAVPLKPILQKLSDRLAAGENVSRREPDPGLGGGVLDQSWTSPTQTGLRLTEMPAVMAAIDGLAGALLDSRVDPALLRQVVNQARNFSEKAATGSLRPRVGLQDPPLRPAGPGRAGARRVPPGGSLAGRPHRGRRAGPRQGGPRSPGDGPRRGTHHLRRDHVQPHRGIRRPAPTDSPSSCRTMPPCSSTRWMTATTMPPRPCPA